VRQTGLSVAQPALKFAYKRETTEGKASKVKDAFRGSTIKIVCAV
jgi:hypothetical protein